MKFFGIEWTREMSVAFWSRHVEEAKMENFLKWCKDNPDQHPVKSPFYCDPEDIYKPNPLLRMVKKD
jgi:hypothetical protein